MILTLLPLAARSGTGAGDAQDVLGHPTAELALLLASLLPAANVSVQVETSDEGIVWLAAGAAVSLNTGATGVRQELRRSALGRYVRASWSVTNGPATFGLTGEKLQVLATRDDILKLGWVPHGLEQFPDDDVDKVLGTRSSFAVGYLNAHKGVVPPLLGWGGDVRWAVVQLAVYDLYVNKGTLDPIAVNRATEALEWLKGVAANKISPTGLVSSPVAPPSEAESPGVDVAWAWSDKPWGFR